MSLYICPNCHKSFDEPFIEAMPIPGRGVERYSTCPRCGSPDFEESWQCKGCNKDGQWSDMIAGEYCDECITLAASDPEIVWEFLMLDDVKESFAEFLAERQWTPKAKWRPWKRVE